MSVINVVIVMVATAAATRQYATASTAAAPTGPRTAACAAKAKRLSRRGLRCCSRYARGRESCGNGYRGGHGGHTARWRKGASTLARLRDAGAGTAHAAAALLVPRIDRGVAKEFGGAVVGRRVAPPCGLARTCRPPLALHVRRQNFNLYSKIRQHRSLQIENAANAGQCFSSPGCAVAGSEAHSLPLIRLAPACGIEGPPYLCSFALPHL